MEHLLRQLAEQLDSLDEASLMNLWDKYAQRTHDFTPSREWEIDVLVYCLIQAKHMKNQLFNYCWSHQDEVKRKPAPDEPVLSGVGFRRQLTPEERRTTFALRASEVREALKNRAGKAQQPCAVLRFDPNAGRKRGK